MLNLITDTVLSWYSKLIHSFIHHRHLIVWIYFVSFWFDLFDVACLIFLALNQNNNENKIKLTTQYCDRKNQTWEKNFDTENVWITTLTTTKKQTKIHREYILNTRKIVSSLALLFLRTSSNYTGSGVQALCFDFWHDKGHSYFKIFFEKNPQGGNPRVGNPPGGNARKIHVTSWNRWNRWNRHPAEAPLTTSGLRLLVFF